VPGRTREWPSEIDGVRPGGLGSRVGLGAYDMGFGARDAMGLSKLEPILVVTGGSRARLFEGQVQVGTP
jgi:hypothetical protein